MTKYSPISLTLAVAFLCWASEVWGKGIPSADRPHIPAIKVNAAPKIDGLLNDEAWQKAAKVTGFWRLDKDELAEEQTEVLICYDDVAVYIAFVCHDSQPHLIRAQQKKRGGGLWGDDFVSVNIDPLNQPRIFSDEYTFMVNPLGTQSEWVPGGAAAKIEWRGDWQAAAKITERGWQVEIAIPFRIFRLPRKPKAFSIHFSRTIPAPRLIDSTFPYRRGQAIANTAEWGPLDLPRFQSPLLFMPSVTFALGGEDKGMRSGLDIKQYLPNGLQWQGTLNPDFRNVEDVVETIDFTYVPRALPDRRPFFTEGQDYFPSRRVFYSRLVKDVAIGTKLFGKVERARIGFLGVYESNSRLTLASCLSYDLNKFWSARAEYAHRTRVGMSPAYRFSLSGYVPQGKDWRWILGGDLIHAGAGGWSLSLRRSSQSFGRISFGFGFSELGNLKPSAGFAPEVNYREFFWNIGYDKRYEKGPILMWDCFVHSDERRFRGGQGKGQLLDESKGASVWVTGRAGWALGCYYSHYRRPPFRDRILSVSFSWNTFDRYRSGNASYSWGKRAGANYRFLTFDQSLRISEKWTINIGYERLRHEHRTYQLVISGVYDLTPEKSLMFRWVKGSQPEFGAPQNLLSVDNFYLGFRQFSRKGIDIYLLLGDPNSRRTRFKLLVKFVQVF